VLRCARVIICFEHRIIISVWACTRKLWISHCFACSQKQKHWGAFAVSALQVADCKERSYPGSQLSITSGEVSSLQKKDFHSLSPSRTRECDTDYSPCALGGIHRSIYRESRNCLVAFPSSRGHGCRVSKNSRCGGSSPRRRCLPCGIPPRRNFMAGSHNRWRILFPAMGCFSWTDARKWRYLHRYRDGIYSRYMANDSSFDWDRLCGRRDHRLPLFGFRKIFSRDKGCVCSVSFYRDDDCFGIRGSHIVIIILTYKNRDLRLNLVEEGKSRLSTLELFEGALALAAPVPPLEMRKTFLKVWHASAKISKSGTGRIPLQT